jgi:imidazole glycerol-phosphate synthase subunit HisH
MNVLIVDYGLGNLWSVKSAFEFIGASVTITADPQAVARAECLVLPGVGAFGIGMQNLHARGLVDALNEAVLGRGAPLLGICLGMQLLADASEEAPGVQGLGWIAGKVLKFREKNLRLPHMGFNSALPSQGDNPILPVGREAADFYFVHSYCFVPNEEAHVLARTYYGVSFVSGVRKDNIFGVQFHPEKSQSSGLRLISDFVRFSSGTCTNG